MKNHFILFSVALFFLSSCAALRDATDVQEPEVTFTNVSIQNITFEGVTLLFDFDVTNPNRRGVSADGYSYEFFINDESFISGREEERIEVGSESTSSVQIPVSLNFSNVYDSFRSVLRQDSVSYKMATDVTFSLPVIGSRTVPVEANGQLPLPRIPQINFGGFEMKSLSFRGAEAEVTFRVRNPNAFGIVLDGADYQLQVNGNNWLDTELSESIKVSESSSEDVTIPVRLSSSQMGSALIEMMGGRKEFDYRLTGSAQISADLEGFDEVQTIPFDLQGVLNIDDY